MDDVALTHRICELLADVDGWEYRPDGPNYTPTEVGIFYGSIDPDPDRAVGVRVYAPDDRPLEFITARRVQLRIRGAKGRRDGADQLASLAHERLQDLSRVGGISRMTRLSFSPLGADENGRQERTENYLVTLDNKEAAL